jgi:tRNA dimethylallyltransferase
MIKNLPKLVVILGQTATGKTALSIKLAKKFNGEIISADSRQVYKGMNIGTGKVTKKEMRGIPHYLLDVANPKRRFTVTQYRKLAIKAIKKIHQKGKNPFLVGGTGFYIQAIVDGMVIPEVKPDWKLRKRLEKKSTEELYEILKKLDPRRIRTIEKENPRRLIRAIEIVLKTKRPVPILKFQPLPYPVLIIGIKKTLKELKKLIKNRLLKRLKRGMVAEVRRLRKEGLSWRRLEEFGLEYRFIAQYLQKKINYYEMTEKIQKESKKFTKRQITWFKRDKRIKWIKNYQEVRTLIKNYLRQ